MAPTATSSSASASASASDTASKPEPLPKEQCPSLANSRSPLRWWFEFLVGLVTVAAHGWFLYYMENDYNDKYAPSLWSIAPGADHHAYKVRNYVSIWVPIFLLSIVLEALYSGLLGLKLYRFNDMISSLSLGMMMAGTKALIAQAWTLSPYIWVWEHYAVAHDQWWQKGSFGWWSMLVAVEFGYYWVHRTGHTINAFWAMHSIHHSSEEYNLSTALRQSSIHGIVSWAYYMPLAFFYPPQLFLLHNQYNLLYQFWIHTQALPKLGPLEWVLNTPSQHRVHHGRNAYCIDKNYGGTLCIFDRMFGTFQEEIEQVPVVYGLTHSINTTNPVEANIINWRYIWTNLCTLKSLKHKFYALFQGPGWIPGSDPIKEYPIPPCTLGTVQQYDPQVSLVCKVYVFLHFFACLISQSVAMDLVEGDGPISRAFYLYSIAAICTTLLSLVSFSSLIDRRPYCVRLELFRLLGTACLLMYGIHTFIPAVHLDALEPWYLHKYCLAVYGVLLVSIAVLLLNARQLVRPLDESEIGKDHPRSAEAEQAQLRAAGMLPAKAHAE